MDGPLCLCSCPVPSTEGRGDAEERSDEAGGSDSVWRMPPAAEGTPLRRRGAASPRLAAVGQEMGISP